jgi:hypothetical protein
MRVAVIALAALLSLSVPTSAHAKFASTVDLHRACSARQGASDFLVQYTACLHYIAGAADNMDEARIRQGKRTCIPDGMHDFEVKNIVVRYLEQHPEKWHLPVPAVLRMAFVEEFPGCR